MNNYSIYSLKEPGEDAIRYIGITKHLKTRYYVHINERKKTHKCNWVKSLKSKGLIPEMNVLEDGITFEEAVKKEVEYILFFKSVGARLVNQTAGGEGVKGYKITEETRKKFSLARKGKKLSDYHRKRISEGNKGRLFSEKARAAIIKYNETKVIDEAYKERIRLKIAHKRLEINKNISLSKKGKKLSAEHIEKVRKKNIGKTRSEEIKKRMSEVRRGRVVRPSSIEKMKRTIANRTPEFKKKIADATRLRFTGKKLSEEHKRKVSENSANKKAVIQMDLNGGFIKYWDSAYETRNGGYNHSAVHCCCSNGRLKSHHGYKWYFKKDLLPVLISHYK